MKRVLIAIILGLAVNYGLIANGNPVRDYGHGKRMEPVQYGIPFKGVPDSRDVSIYQVNMRCFSADHKFKSVTKRLDNIKALGVNVIYLMPIYPVGKLKSTNSPYCIRDYKAVNPEFGTLNDLRTLIQEAHKRNMAVILDFVANHTSWDNPWIKEHPSWYKHDSIGNIVIPHNWYDVAQLNFANQNMRNALINAMKYWVLTANCDGFRCDYADGPPVDFWKQAIDTLRSIKNHKLLLLAEGSRAENFTAGFDYNFGFKFYYTLKKIYAKNVSVRKIDSLNIADYRDASPKQLMVRYLTNHDVNSSDGTPLELFGGERGSMAAFVVVAYMKGVPFIYDGQEVGTPIRLTFPFTSTTIDWNINPDVTAEYAKILNFRDKSEAIRRGLLTSYDSDDVCAFTKSLGNEKIFVISNLRNDAIDYIVPRNLVDTEWKNAFKNQSLSLGTHLKLQPYSYLVLKNQ